MSGQTKGPARQSTRVPAAARHALRRPSISPLLWAAAAAFGGARLGTEAALSLWMHGSTVPTTACWVAAIALLGCAVWRRGAVRVCAGMLAAGMAVALLHGGWLASAASDLATGGVTRWNATVVSDPVEGAFGTNVKVALDAAPWGLGTTIAWPSGQEAPEYGRRVVLSGRVKCAARVAGPPEEAFRRGDLARMSPWKVEVAGWAGWPLGPVAAWRADAVARTIGIGAPGTDLLVSMLFGVPASGDATVALEDARAAGVAWAVTASGLHLAALVMLIDRLAAVAGLQRRGRALASLVCVMVFALAAGLRLSLVRAAIVATASTASRAVGRRRDATAALGVAVASLVLLDPTAAYDSGLLLGTIAVTSIALFGGLVASWLTPAVGRAASRALGSSVAAQVAVGPLSAAMFGSVALGGPLVLIGSAPLVTGAVMLGMAGAVTAPVAAPFGEALAHGGAVLAQMAARVWSLAAGSLSPVIATPVVPWWVGPLWLGAAALAWTRWPLPRRSARVRAVSLAVAAALIVPSLFTPTFGGGVDVLDVGQGDAILIRDGSHSLLVDTGPDPVVLRKALKRAGVKSLDGVVLTHAHADHTGGTRGLAGVARPGWIGVPDVEDDDVDRLAAECGPATDEVVRLRRDMTWRVGAITVRVLWPCGGERSLPTNDTSVVLLLEREGRRALLLGDAEDVAQRGVLQVWSAPVDVVKVAHHGSPNGNVPDALALWSPPLALISVGTGNTFGHPSRAALDTLTGVGATVRRTDLEGDLMWSFEAADGSSAATAAMVGLCDNLYPGALRALSAVTHRGTAQWPPLTCRISSRSISSTARRSCFLSAPRGDCGSAWPRWPTSTSTWRRSTGARPPPTTS